MTQKFYEQQLDASATGFFSNIGGQVGADQFTFSEDVTITGINWYGFYGSDLNPSITSIDFELSFYLDNSGVPTSNPISQQILSAQVQDTGLQEQGQFSSSIYEFQTDLISPLEIAAAETTWIAIAENDTLTPAFGNTQWLWSFSLPGTESTKAFRNTNPNLASDWEITTGQLAFALTGETSGSVTNGEEEATLTTVTKLTDGGQGSLRQAIINANASPEDDIIELAEGTYTLTLSGTGENAGTTGDLDIINNGTLTIIGLGNGATIEATALGDRVFQVLSGAVLNLENVIVTGGAAIERDDGGGIYNGGSLTLTQSTVSNSSALNGGGIYNQGLATLINSNLSNNFTAFVPGVGRGGGGGILNSGGDSP